MKGAIALGLLGALLWPALAHAAPRAIVGVELVGQTGSQPLIPELYGGAEPQRAEPPLRATPAGGCGPGSRPYPGLQGRVPASSAQGYTCNTELVGSEGATGGFKVERYVDQAGHDCAYYDTALLFPFNGLPDVRGGVSPGVAVLDMSDPRRPRRTATLTTPAMLTPHESLLVNAKRGLLAAAAGNLAFAPGIVDLYDISQDCRTPKLQSSTVSGVLGHESGFAPDGNTLYITSLFTNTVVAIDVRDPRVPAILTVGAFPSHALTVSDDGTRGYVAGLRGLEIVDLSEVQSRKVNPQIRPISGLSWQSMTIPQTALPVTIKGRRMLIETDEFSYDDSGIVASNGANVGAARIIDISDEDAPRVISNLRLQVHEREHRAEIANDPAAGTTPANGYAAHYCGVPRETDPGIVACSMINSGLRVFDVRDPAKPREIAYYVGEPRPFLGSAPGADANWAMSRPAFDEQRGDIWYSDGNAGFRVVHLTNDVWPFPAHSAVGLPGTRRCLSRRAFTVHLRPRSLRRARVTLNGKRLHVRRVGTKLTARVDLTGRPKQVVVLRVRATTARGRTVRETRRYRTCVPKHART